MGDGVVVQHQGLDGGHVPIVQLLADGVIQAGGNGLVVGHGFYGSVVGHGVYFVQDLPIQRRGHLSAVVPVDLVAIVSGGIVGGGNHHAGGAAQGADGKGQHGNRPQGVKAVGGDAVGVEAQGGFLGKLRGHMPGVKGDGYAFGSRSLFQNEVCQTLGGLADGIQVHAVAAGAQDTPQTAGAEGQVPIEPVLNLGGVARVCQGFQLRSGRFVEVGIAAPLLVTFHCIHMIHLHSYCILLTGRCMGHVVQFLKYRSEQIYIHHRNQGEAQRKPEQKGVQE